MFSWLPPSLGSSLCSAVIFLEHASSLANQEKSSQTHTNILIYFSSKLPIIICNCFPFYVFVIVCSPTRFFKLSGNLIAWAFPWLVVVESPSRLRLFCNLMDCNLPGSSVHEIFRQEYWSGLPCPPSGDIAYLGIEPVSLASPALQAKSLPTELPGSWLFSDLIWVLAPFKIPTKEKLCSLGQPIFK